MAPGIQLISIIDDLVTHRCDSHAPFARVSKILTSFPDVIFVIIFNEFLMTSASGVVGGL